MPGSVRSRLATLRAGVRDGGQHLFWGAAGLLFGTLGVVLGRDAVSAPTAAAIATPMLVVSLWLLWGLRAGEFGRDTASFRTFVVIAAAFTGAFLAGVIVEVVGQPPQASVLAKGVGWVGIAAPAYLFYTMTAGSEDRFAVVDRYIEEGRLR